MKIIRDKGRTLLPREDAIFLLSRILTLIVTIWFLIFHKLSRPDFLILIILAGAFVFQMTIFWLMVSRGKYDLKKAYLSIIIFDLVLLSALIKFDGGYSSDFYLLYYLTVAFSAYILTFPPALIITATISVAYILLAMGGLQEAHRIIPVLIRLGFMWFLLFTIAYISDFIRRSERRLLNLFDTLNLRTSELERSQAHLEMIYENSRALAGILDVDGAIEQVMRIMGDLLTYPASGLILVGPGGNLIYRGRNTGGQTNFHLKAVDAARQELILRVIRQSETVTVVNIAGRNDYQPLRTNTRAIMLVPMIAQGKTIGLLAAESPQEGAFNEKDEKMLLEQFEENQQDDLMDKVFFPFTEPNLLFQTPDKSVEFFVNFNEVDGNGVIIGYKVGSNDLRRSLMWFCEAASLSGMRYIELLVNAFRPDLQRIALDARFLPCAYFPAMRMTVTGGREDYIVFSRSFESLDFMEMNLVSTNRKFLDAFMKCWYEMLVRCQPDFDEGWRIV